MKYIRLPNEIESQMKRRFIGLVPGKYVLSPTHCGAGIRCLSARTWSNLLRRLAARSSELMTTVAGKRFACMFNSGVSNLYLQTYLRASYNSRRGMFTILNYNSLYPTYRVCSNVILWLQWCLTITQNFRKFLAKPRLKCNVSCGRNVLNKLRRRFFQAVE